MLTNRSVSLPNEGSVPARIHRTFATVLRFNPGPVQGAQVRVVVVVVAWVTVCQKHVRFATVRMPVAAVVVAVAVPVLVSVNTCNAAWTASTLRCCA